MLEWWSPTRRAVRWTPLLVATALAGVALVVVRLQSRLLVEPAQVIALATIVIGAVSGLHDPARNFVQAAPVSAAHRLVHRMVMLVPLAAPGRGQARQGRAPDGERTVTTVE